LNSVAKFNTDLDKTFNAGGEFAVTKKANADSIKIMGQRNVFVLEKKIGLSNTQIYSLLRVFSQPEGTHHQGIWARISWGVPFGNVYPIRLC
jgi:hypothetical protein